MFEGSIIAYAFQTAFGGEMWMWSLLVVICSTPLIIGGVRRFLDKFNGCPMPLYFFGLLDAVILSSLQYPATDGNWMTHAVSYTHLDVYKRQSQSRTPTWQTRCV